MCGIVGILHLDDKKIDKSELISFRDSLSHRGPDGSNIFINENQTTGLGHTRLSILDLSERSNQPMSLREKKLTLVFNGEIYNFLEIKKELEMLGYKFNTTSDTEVLIAAYDKWGSNCQNKFNGMWAFAIWNEIEKKLFVSRDRFGEKPFYYLLNNNKFYFASELKSFMFLNKKNKPDFNFSNFSYCSAENYNNSYVVTEDTFLKNVKELNPGYELTVFRNKNIKIKKWWSTIENLVEVPKTYEEQKEKFIFLFQDSCNLRMRSDVDISTSLSGGLDSSSIAAIINNIKKTNSFMENSRNPYKTFVLDYENEKNTEIVSARTIAEENNLETIFINLNLNLLQPDELIKIIYHQEEVTGDDGVGPWYIYKKIKENNIKVSIDGHGADELLAGYSGYPRIAMRECGFKEYKRWLDLCKIHLKMNDLSIENRALIYILINKLVFVIKNKFKKKLSDNSFYDFLDIKSVRSSILPHDNVNGLSELNQALYIDYHYKSSQLNLKKYDKFSMAHGVESRLPFFDWRLATYLFSLPSKVKINDGLTKKILRDSLKMLLPKKITEKVKKKGFTPDVELFNRTLKNFIIDTIYSKKFKEMGIWKMENIKKIINCNEEVNFKKIFKIIQIFYLIKTFKEIK